MSNLIDIKVPDIGDFHDVPVIEIHAAVEERIEAEVTLLTLESDKATLDVPAPVAGVLKEIRVKVGDKVSQGHLIAVIETTASKDAGEDKLAGTSASSSPVAPVTSPVPEASPVSAQTVSQKPSDAASLSPDAFDLLVLGGGPGGYSAAFRAADLGLKVALVERYPTLGGVCLNVGCIPSKALLHVAAVIEETQQGAALGVHFDPPRIDLDALRAHKEKVVSKLTQGLAGMAKARKVTVVEGTGRFVDAHHLSVSTREGEQTLAFRQAIIAAGSEAVKLPFLPEDPRIVSSTGALKLPFVPKHLLVIGGGIIGLEMATVYSALGARISVVEMTESLMPGVDRDMVKVFEKRNAHRFERQMFKTRVKAVEARPEGLRVHFEGEQAPEQPQDYDLILVSAGRVPNGRKIAAEQAGVFVDERGFIPVDRQQRSNINHIFAIGDIVGQPMLAHKAVHEAHVAAEAAAGQKSFFDARVIPAVAYTHPEIAWVGLTETRAKAEGIVVEKGLFPWAASGRAIANDADYGFTKLLFDANTQRIVGGAIVGPNAGDMIGEIALAIEMGADALDIGKTIHPHPTLGETIGLAAEAAHGACTDLPPARKTR